ncbi:LAMI_0D05710g1_1 [Lachancea mirantina]|uniref:Telomerase reverse transcriptase n=1 Tax=Lachancea mirantina TaxID=1230905 RepID=A0A1G4JB89_9SACH|nr:LAMI_0D05710g1_1 [Lachancea mirantina]
MRCLRQFITEEWGNSGQSKDFQERLNAIVATGGIDIVKVLDNCQVIPNRLRINCPFILADSHGELVDKIIIYLIQSGASNNVLSGGYKIARNEQINRSVHCEATNSSVKKLKSGAWRAIAGVLGPELFTELLINHSIFESHGTHMNQISGTQPDKRGLSDVQDLTSGKTIRKCASLEPLLYKDKQTGTAFSILPTNATLWLEDVLKDAKLMARDLDAVNIARLRFLFSVAVKRHKKLNYRAIVDKLCPGNWPANAQSNFDYQTDKKNVVKFIVAATNNLFPYQLFGNKSNRSKVYAKLAVFLQLKVNEELPFQIITHKFRWKELSKSNVLRERGPRALSINVEIGEAFIRFVFKNFIPRLLKAFFHVTEELLTKKAIFFKHETWSRMTRPFLQNYTLKYLKTKSLSGHLVGDRFSSSPSGSLRLIPKPSLGCFRVIYVSAKCRNMEEKAFWREYQRRKLKPTLCILNHLKKVHFPESTTLKSPNDIPERLRHFKNSFLQEGKSLSDLHYIKFDIRDCYDSVPVSKVHSLILDAFKEETDFVVRSGLVFTPSTEKIRRVKSINGSSKYIRNTTYVDHSAAIHITKEVLLDVVRRELSEIQINIGGNRFVRKEGIFQGAALSATFVDYLYEDLVSHYDEFRQEKGTSLLLRLADDFLMISTESSQINKLKNLVKKGFPDYNAIVNESKVQYSGGLPHEHIIKFCGLNIDSRSLDCYKSSEMLNVTRFYSLSANAIYASLLNTYRRRLIGNLFIFELNSWSSILKHLEANVANIAESFVRSTKYLDLELHTFKAFYDEMLSVTLRLCLRGNVSSSRKKLVETAIEQIIWRSVVEKLPFNQVMPLRTLELIDEF